VWVEEEEEEKDRIDDVQSRTEIADPRYNVWVWLRHYVPRVEVVDVTNMSHPPFQ